MFPQFLDILNNHKFDEGWKNKKKKPFNHDNNKKDYNKNNNKSDAKSTEASFAQNNKGFQENTCFCCSKKGHWSKDCRFKDKPKSEWAITKGTQHLHSITEVVQDNSQSDDTSEISTPSKSSNASKSTSWLGKPNLMNIAFMNHNSAIEISQANIKQAEIMKENIILDNGSTIDLFMNKEFIQDIRAADQPMELHTNTGSKMNNNNVTVTSFGEVWYDEDAIANIFSLKI